MKRGFIKDKHLKAARPKPDGRQFASDKPLIRIPVTRVVHPYTNAPMAGKFLSPFKYEIVRLPPYDPLNASEPIAPRLLFPGAKERILARPGFPPAPFIHPTPLPYHISDIWERACLRRSISNLESLYWPKGQP